MNATVPVIEFARGETVILKATCRLDQALFDLTGYDIFFTLRDVPADLADTTDAGALIKKNSTDSGIIVAVPASGEVEIRLLPSETKALPANQPLYYDLRIKASDTVINSPVAEGILRVIENQTNRIYS